MRIVIGILVAVTMVITVAIVVFTDWLENKDGEIIAIATVVLVGITGYYADLTRQMLKANNTPEIAISLRPHEAYIHCVMLCIENIGTGAARNIQFQTDLSFKPDGDRALEEVGFLKKGIGYLGPGQKIEHFLVSVIGKLDELKKTPLEFTVTYTGAMKQKQKYEHTFYLDFGEDEGLATVGKTPLYEIAEAVKEIKKDLHNVTTGIRKPVILTESVSENSIRNHTDFLESRISEFPPNTQQRILQKLEFFIDEQNREIREKTVNDEEIVSEENSS